MSTQKQQPAELSDFEQMVFDAFKATYNQGKCSMMSNNHTCAYRSDCGTAKCFVGHIIPDDKYEPGFENATLRSERIKSVIQQVLGREMSYREEDLLLFMQLRVHDRANKPGEGSFHEQMLTKARSVLLNFEHQNLADTIQKWVAQQKESKHDTRTKT